ncbi:MAG: YHYH protein [Planctomycetota bacterium]
MRIQQLRLPNRRLVIFAFSASLVLAAGLLALAQGHHMRRHTAVAKQRLTLVPADQKPPAASEHTFDPHDGHRHVSANGIPNHDVGRFPNRRNPNSIRAQHYQFSLPVNPKPAEKITPIHNTRDFGPPNMPFGIAVNGVVFDPGTAEFWNGDRQAGWNYEALSGAVSLGVDANHAHVQPTGAYHYHGIPTMLLKELGHSSSKHSPLIGWAADGFPIYCQYGYREPQDPTSKTIELRSSFGVKDGNRPGAPDGPGSKYDGTFVQDYTYDEGIGHLDECNGRFCKTPEFPDGTYAYFLTSEWPVIPRAFRGTPLNLR